MVPRVDFLGHLQVVFASIYNTFACALLNNVLLEPLLRIFRRSLILVEAGAICQLCRNVGVSLQVGSIASFWLLSREILVEGDERGELPHACRFRYLVLRLFR